jgi:outer membrane protein
MRNASLTLIGVLLALAAAPAAMADTKIISIRAGELVQASPQFKQGQAQMKTEFEKRKNDLEAEAKKLSDDVQNYKKEADVMSPEARTKAEYDLQTRKIDFDKKQKAFGDDFQKRDRELSEKLMAGIKQVVLQVAQEKGADLVVQDPVYAAPGVDVTDEVLKKLQAGGIPAAPLKN